MVSIEAIVVVAGWSISMFVALFVVPKLAAKKTMRMFGLVRVKNGEGDDIYAVEGPDGDPIKVPVARVDKDGKVKVQEEYAPLAYSLPTLAAMQIKASFQGKVGKMVQNANSAVLEGMDINQASTAMALQAFAKGQYGKALIAYLTPKIAQSINQLGGAGQANPENGGQRGSGGRPI